MGIFSFFTKKPEVQQDILYKISNADLFLLGSVGIDAATFSKELINRWNSEILEVNEALENANNTLTRDEVILFKIISYYKFFDISYGPNHESTTITVNFLESFISDSRSKVRKILVDVLLHKSASFLRHDLRINGKVYFYNNNVYIDPSDLPAPDLS